MCPDIGAILAFRAKLGIRKRTNSASTWHPMTLPTLSLLETRVLGVLVEKQHTVPDTYPLTLNALIAGCNQKTSRDPILNATESEAQAAIDHLKSLSLVVESSGGRVMRYAHNVGQGAGGPVAIGGAAGCADAARAANGG